MLIPLLPYNIRELLGVKIYIIIYGIISIYNINPELIDLPKIRSSSFTGTIETIPSTSLSILLFSALNSSIISA